MTQRILLLALLAGCTAPRGAATASSPARQAISLDGDWLFQTNGTLADIWKPVKVPSHWESHEGTNSNGIGWYRRQVEPLELLRGKRVLFHFQAAATETEVWWNGTRLGCHLGGWTPFRFDITRLIQQSPGRCWHLSPPTRKAAPTLSGAQPRRT